MGRESLDDHTRSGLDFMVFGFYAYILLYALTGISFLAWSYEPSEDIGGILFFVGLVAIAGSILFLVGIYKIYKGSDKVFREHQKKVKISVWLIIIGFLIKLLSPSLHFSSIEALRSSLIATGIASLITMLCYSIAPILLIYELARESTKKYLYTGGGLIVAASLFRLSWALAFIDIQTDMEVAVISTLRVLSVLMLIIAGGYLFFVLGYRKPIKSIEKKSESSETVLSEPSKSSLSSQDECPNCGSKEFRKYLDGSGYCDNCGETFSGNS